MITEKQQQTIVDLLTDAAERLAIVANEVGALGQGDGSRTGRSARLLARYIRVTGAIHKRIADDLIQDLQERG